MGLHRIVPITIYIVFIVGVLGNRFLAYSYHAEYAAVKSCRPS